MGESPKAGGKKQPRIERGRGGLSEVLVALGLVTGAIPPHAAFAETPQTIQSTEDARIAGLKLILKSKNRAVQAAALKVFISSLDDAAPWPALARAFVSDPTFPAHSRNKDNPVAKVLAKNWKQWYGPQTRDLAVPIFDATRGTFQWPYHADLLDLLAADPGNAQAEKLLRESVRSEDLYRHYARYKSFPWVIDEIQKRLRSNRFAISDASATSAEQMQQWDQRLIDLLKKEIRSDPIKAYTAYRWVKPVLGADDPEFRKLAIDGMTFADIRWLIDKKAGGNVEFTADELRTIPEHVGMTPHRELLEIAVSFFEYEGLGQGDSQIGPPYRHLIGPLKIPKNIDWRAFYPLARTVDATYWTNMIERFKQHSTKSPLLKRMRAFSHEHEEHDPFELGAAVFNVYQYLHNNNIAATPPNIGKAVAHLKELQSSYDSIDPLGPERDVILIVHDQKKYDHRSHKELDEYEDFSPDIEKEFAARRKGAPYHLIRKQPDETLEQVKARIEQAIVQSHRPLTIFFFGHGLSGNAASDGMYLTKNGRITMAEFQKALATRHRRLPRGAGSTPEQMTLFFANTCYGFDLLYNLNVGLVRDSVPPIYADTMADRARLGYKDSSKYNSAYLRHFIAAKNIGEFRILNMGPDRLNKPAVVIPEPLGKRRPRHPFTQTSGFFPPNLQDIS